MDRLIGRMEPGTKLPEHLSLDLLHTLQAEQTVVDRGVSSMMTGRALLDRSLPSLKEPLLIVWGQNDQLTPVSVGETMHGMLPNSELHILEGCGHLAPARCSARAAAATADFLKANPVLPGGVRTLTRMQ